MQDAGEGTCLYRVGWRVNGREEEEKMRLRTLRRSQSSSLRWRLLCSSIYQTVGVVLLTWQASPRVEEDLEKCRGRVAEIEDGVHWLARWL